MTGFEPIEWLAIGAVGAAAAIGLLHIVGVRLRNDREFADLVERATVIRRRHEARLRALRTGVDEEDEGDVIIVDEAEPEPAARQAA